mmetsp:Transcript_19471/g.62504  ORF Transcript_19471/g.62504 Transcript_19471/m.62504 type:complete len:225 (-) Transcript_19471:1434-2108(-)
MGLFEGRFLCVGLLCWCCTVLAIVSTTRKDWTLFALEETDGGDLVTNKYRLGLWRGKKNGEDDDDFVVNKSDNGIDDNWYWNPARLNRASSLASVLVSFLVGLAYVGLAVAPRQLAIEWVGGFLMLATGVFDWIAIVHFMDKVDNEYQRQAEFISEVRTCWVGCQLQLAVGFAAFSLGIIMLSIANNVPFMDVCAVKAHDALTSKSHDDDDKKAHDESTPEHDV